MQDVTDHWSSRYKDDRRNNEDDGTESLDIEGDFIKTLDTKVLDEFQGVIDPLDVSEGPLENVESSTHWKRKTL